MYITVLITQIELSYYTNMKSKETSANAYLHTHAQYTSVTKSVVYVLQLPL